MRLWRFRNRGTAVQLPWLASLTLVLVLQAPCGGAAQPDRAAVRVGGRPLFRVGTVEPASAEERAQRIERRLVLLQIALPDPALQRVRLERPGVSNDSGPGKEEGL